MSAFISKQRLNSARDLVSQLLINERVNRGHWEGELSSSSLSTATACLALKSILDHSRFPEPNKVEAIKNAIQRGLEFLLHNQNHDGGFGDTDLSKSNISTSMLCLGTLKSCSDFCHNRGAHREVVTLLEQYVTREGGVPAVVKRYGKDRTFSVPILTHCAIAGIVDWKHVPQLPFELACFPAEMYAALSLPVVSYALPALIAIGNVKFQKSPWSQWWMTFFRSWAVKPSLRKLEKIQPENGGFLEATPLTSFVLMSLANANQADHLVVQSGLLFLLNSQRKDGSWPIDTNLATWTTTLSVNAFSADDLDKVDCQYLLHWILNQQYKLKHPYTNAAPGGWAWTNLPGGVPDADDTPGAMLAIIKLAEQLKPNLNSQVQLEIKESLLLAGRWLTQLQNRDGGFPTFCRGWGNLPFDRSANDITAHCLRALSATGIEEFRSSILRGKSFLKTHQRAEGSWLPLWFGNQHNHDDENPVFGTSRVLMSLLPEKDETWVQKGIGFLLSQQNEDGGWGGAKWLESTIEESSLALEVLMNFLQLHIREFNKA